MKCSKRKVYSKISTIPKKSLRNCPFFPNAIACSPNFLTSANTDSRQNVSFDCSEIVVKLPDQTLLKNNLHTFLRGYFNNSCFGRIIKTASLVPFHIKSSNCPIHPPITTVKPVYSRHALKWTPG